MEIEQPCGSHDAGVMQEPLKLIDARDLNAHLVVTRNGIANNINRRARIGRKKQGVLRVGCTKREVGEVHKGPDLTRVALKCPTTHTSIALLLKQAMRGHVLVFVDGIQLTLQ